MSSDPRPGDTYPPAPWRMVGQLWLTLFRLREAIDEARPAGVHGVAFVDYEDGSPLTYSELLAARPVQVEGHRHVSISDIWVDSAASMAGGRELWAIPKDLCDFTRRTTRRGPLVTTAWSASLDGREIASARFRDLAGVAPRLPFRGATWQQRPGGSEVTARLSGSARTTPASGRWEFAPDGPLGWLAGHRPVATFRMRDFRMSFG